MPATKGVRNPGLLRRGPREEEREPVAYVVATKPLRYGDHRLTAGTEVPGAAQWPRLQAWISSRALRPVYEGDDFTTFEQFLEDYHFSQIVAEVAQQEPPVEDEQQEE